MYVDAAARENRLDEPIRTQPVRTFVVSPDAAYRRRASSVLGSLGPVALADESLEEPAAIARRVEDECPDVVVLDATGCEAGMRRVIARLAQTVPRIGVVVVCHHCTEAGRALGALPKWGWTEDLRCGVESARREGNPLCPAALRSLRRVSRRAAPRSRPVPPPPSRGGRTDRP